jgi:ankyrin repeat protein
MAGVLLDRGATVNITDRYQRTPLHLACAEGDIEMVKFLLKRGRADPVCTHALSLSLSLPLSVSVSLSLSLCLCLSVSVSLSLSLSLTF